MEEKIIRTIFLKNKSTNKEEKFVIKKKLGQESANFP